MLSNILLIIILITVIFFIVILFVSSKESPEKKESIILEPETGLSKLQCMSQAVPCNPSNGDEDCKQKCFRQDLKCTEITIPSTSKNTYGSISGICAPADVKTNCQNGILTWTANDQTMEWDCICPYPTIAGANDCNLNANVCDGKSSSFDWNIDSKTSPYYSQCKSCPPGYIQFDKHHSAGPICIPEKLKLWYYKSYGSVFTSEDGKYKVLVDIGTINKSITGLNPIENKNKNQKFIKFTNELGSSFYIPENSLIIFLENYQLSNFVKN